MARAVTRLVGGLGGGGGKERLANVTLLYSGSA